jgi:hypothetical protein
VPRFAVGAVVVAVVPGVTSVVVVPVMRDEGCGVLAGWRRFLPAVREHVDEYLVYLVLSVVLSWIGGFAVSVVVGIVAAVVFLPLAIVGGVAFFGSGGSPLALAVVAPLALVAVVVVAVAAAAVRVPVLVYLRYYALLELGDTSGHDLIAERRAEIRGE